MYKVQMTESAPSTLCSITNRSLSMPMHFIVMDLIGKVKSLPQEYQYTLTVRDMLTNHPWCILIYTKEADKVVHAYLVHIYSKVQWVTQNLVRQWN